VHPDYEVWRIEIPPNATEEEMEEINDTLEAWSENLAYEENTIVLKYGVTQECAEKIVYLRSRSRWTLKKELQLIKWDKAGTSLPDVYSGEF